MANEERSAVKRSHRLRRMAPFAVALLALTLGVASACSSSSDTSTEPGPNMLTASNVLGAWSMNGGESVPAGPPSGPSIEFHDDHTFGYSDGCNDGGGRYTVSGGRVRFTDTVSTAKGCLGTVWSFTDPPRFELRDNGTVLTVGTSEGDILLHRVPGS